MLVGSATRRGVTVISAVLGDPSEGARDADTLALLRHGLRSYRRVQVLRPRRALASVDVKDSDARIAIVAKQGYDRVVRATRRPRLHLQVPAQPRARSPLAPGSARRR